MHFKINIENLQHLHTKHFPSLAICIVLKNIKTSAVLFLLNTLG